MIPEPPKLPETVQQPPDNLPLRKLRQLATDASIAAGRAYEAARAADRAAAALARAINEEAAERASKGERA